MLNSAKASELGKRSSRAGIPNKTTNEIKKMFSELLSENIDQLKEDLNEMKAVERFNSLMQLARYVMPTYKAIEMQANIETNNNSELLDRLMAIDESKFDKL